MFLLIKIGYPTLVSGVWAVSALVSIEGMDEFGKGFLPVHQLNVGAHLRDLTLVHHQDQVCFRQEAEAMSYQYPGLKKTTTTHITKFKQDLGQDFFKANSGHIHLNQESPAGAEIWTLTDHRIKHSGS